MLKLTHRPSLSHTHRLTHTHTRLNTDSLSHTHTHTLRLTHTHTHQLTRDQEVQHAGSERAPGPVQDGVSGTRGVLDVQDPQQLEALKDRREKEMEAEL